MTIFEAQSLSQKLAVFLTPSKPLSPWIYAIKLGYSEVDIDLSGEGWQVLDRTRRASLLSIATAVSLLMFQTPVSAAATADKVTATINKAKILAPGTQIKVRVQGEQALISTFRDQRADDKDSKIDALLLGKTVFEMPGGGITSIVVFFYNTKATNEYRSVAIRSGDVKAFDAGTMSQDELLSSIEIKSGKVQDAATAIESRMMLSAAARRDFQTIERGDELEVSCKMPALSDDEYKFEAYRIASTALAFAGDSATARRVKVTFFDPAEKGKYKQVVIPLNNIDAITKQVAAAFGSLQLNAGIAKLSARDVEPSDGMLLEERTALLAKIQGLEDKGVGVAPFVQAFQGIDARVGQVEQEALKKEIDRLSATIAEQERRYEDAKAHKISKDSTETESKGERNVSDVKEPKARGNISRYALGYFPMLAGYIVRDPEKYLVDCKKKFEEHTKKKSEDDPRFPLALMWFAEVLKYNNFPEDAKKYEMDARILSAKFRAK